MKNKFHKKSNAVKHWYLTKAYSKWFRLTNAMSEKPKGYGVAHIVHRDADGKVLTEYVGKNIVLNEGLDALAKLISATAAPPARLNVIVIGSNATAAAVTNTSATFDEASLTAPTRKSATFSDGTAASAGSKQYTLQVTFNAGEGTGAVEESGIVNNTTAGAGTALNRQTFAVINKGASDSLQVTWTITLT